MNLSTFSAPLLALLLAPGCATTGNPRQGGIFWSEGKAHIRQTHLRRAADYANRDSRRERAISEQLHNKLTDANADLRQARNEIADQPPNSEQARRLAELERERDALERNRSLSLAEREAEAAALRAEISRLRERNRELRRSD